MPDQVLPPRESYMVVVAGTMKPAIHHVQWYRKINAIDDNDLAAALRSPTGVTTPIVSQLQFGSPILTITCNPVQWSILSNHASSWERMLRTSSLVFAKENDPTLTSYVFVSQRHIDTKASDLKALLATCLVDLHLGFPVGKSSGSNISLAIEEEGLTTATSIQTSVLGDHTVFGFYNHQYETNDISGILDGRFERFRSGAEKFFTDVVAAINVLATKG
ncbi:MAG: hypothetical protein WAO35_16265 [Terriglobia bacterium]